MYWHFYGYASWVLRPARAESKITTVFQLAPGCVSRSVACNYFTSCASNLSINFTNRKLRFCLQNERGRL